MCPVTSITRKCSSHLLYPRNQVLQFRWESGKRLWMDVTWWWVSIARVARGWLFEDKLPWPEGIGTLGMLQRIVQNEGRLRCLEMSRCEKPSKNSEKLDGWKMFCSASRCFFQDNIARKTVKIRGDSLFQRYPYPNSISKNKKGFMYAYYGGWKKSCTTSITLDLLMHNLYPRTLKLNVEWHDGRWCRISVTRANSFWSLCLQTILN